MGALGPESIRRGEFVSKRAVFEGVVADPSLDGGVVACCVFGDAAAGGGGGGGRGNASKNPVGGGGGTKKRSAGALGDFGDGAGGATPESGTTVAAATGPSANPDNARNRATDNDNRINDGKSGKTSNKRKKSTVLASASTCATTGGSLAPAAFLPRGSTAAGPRGAGGAETPAAAGALGRGSGGDHRKSSVFVWPGKLEATSGDPGLEAKVPYRLTCVRATAFEARFKGAHNALLAGTREGLALAFDWGCLLRDSRGGGTGGGGDDDGRESGKTRLNGEVLAPSAQVMCARARVCVCVCVCVFV